MRRRRSPTRSIATATRPSASTASSTSASTKRSYVAADEYTIADIAIFPWLRSWQNQGIDWADFPHLKDWFDRIAARPAVERGVEVLAGLRKPLVATDEAREMLFGATQYERR